MAFGNDNHVNGNGNSHLPNIRFEALEANHSDNSNRDYHKPPSEYEASVWHLGWTDGRYGQPPGENEAILRSRSKLHWQEKVKQAEAEIAATQASVSSLEDILERLKARLTVTRTTYEETLKERNEYPQLYSLPLFFIYTIVAFFLFAADLPLSLKLVAMGYGVTTEDKSVNIGERFLSVDNLLSNPLLVVTKFWDAMLLALGIALVAIFIKYFLDAMIYKEEQKTLSKRFVAMMIGVLSLFLLTTVFLGVFRSSQQKQKNITELTEKLRGLKEYRATRSDPSIDSAISDLETRIEDEKKESYWFSVRAISFILLTLMFPITGGICFSVGWRKGVKWRAFYRIRSQFFEVERIYNYYFFRHEEASERLDAQQKRLQQERNDYASGDAYAEMQVSLYRHGYMRGRNVPETIEAGESLYQRCENSVAKLLAKKLRDKYWENQAPLIP